jgi:hypothetical protein
MTDFLTSLVARTIAAPTLTPRLRSRFEPLAFDDAGIVESVREIAINGPASPASSLAAAPRAAEVDREEKAQPVPVSLRKRESASPSPRMAEATRVAPPITPPEETPEPLAPRPEPAVPGPPPRFAEPERTTAPVGHRTAAPPPAETAAASIEHRGTRVETRESTQTVERARTIATRILQRSETARLFAQPPRAATPQAAAAPEPNIHISIGRVEVRAAPAASAVPPRVARRSAVQSLDDYLDRRNRKDGR